MRNIIFNNFWPKIITFALAIATWFYVFDVINKDSFPQKTESAESVFSRYKFIVKDIPVKPVFFGKSPEGYRVVLDKVKIEPERISVFGPEDIIGSIDEIRTDKINLSEYTRSVQLNLGLSSDIDFLDLDEQIVDIYLPIKATDSQPDKKTPEKSAEGSEAVGGGV